MTPKLFLWVQMVNNKLFSRGRKLSYTFQQSVKSCSLLLRTSALDLRRPPLGSTLVWANGNQHRSFSNCHYNEDKKLSPNASPEDILQDDSHFGGPQHSVYSNILCPLSWCQLCLLWCGRMPWPVSAGSITQNPWVNTEEILSQRRQIYPSLWLPFLPECLLGNK